LRPRIHRAIELGINHIETARGYGSSEMQLGRVLPLLPREKIIVQTKVAPAENAKDFLRTFDRSMEYLQLDYVDLLALHGVNHRGFLKWALQKMVAWQQLANCKKEGRIRFLGFSTHATTDIILEAIESGEFDYVNIHWYFVNDLNWRAIEAALKRDMGVFIISPMIREESSMSRRPNWSSFAPRSHRCSSTICIASRRPQVHTLSCGAAGRATLTNTLRD